MTTPGFLSVAGVEVANNQRMAAYLAAGLNTPQFEITSRTGCEALERIAFPLEVCDDLALADVDQLYTNPISTWRVPSTGAVPTSATAQWYEAGYVALPGGNAITSGAVLPDPHDVECTVMIEVAVLAGAPAANRAMTVGRVVNAGTASVGWVGASLTFSTAGNIWALQVNRKIPGGASSFPIVLGQFAQTGGQPVPTSWWLEVVFTAAGFTATVYGGDPHENGDHVDLVPVLFQGAYGYDATPGSAWQTATGQTEAAQLAAVTEIGLLPGVAMFLATELVVTEIDVLPGPPCPDHSFGTVGTTYPGQTAFPADTLYPSSYTFVNPGADPAPWADPDDLDSLGFYGLLLTDIGGLDTTETRSVDDSASGIGGILGPITLAPREMQFEGFLIASGAPAMNYARRWLAQTLGGALCPGCDGNYIDVLPDCGAETLTQIDPDTGVAILPANARRLYDVGLTSLEVDTSDVTSCDYVVPVKFTLAAADPFLYTLPENETTTTLNPAGADAPAIPFESWLFGTAPPVPVCIDLEPPKVGIDAAIVTISTQSGRAITGALVYRSQGTYPFAGLFPGQCVYPADGLPLWDISTCPFVFDIAELDAGESFTVDSSRRRLVRTLASGQEVSGAPSLALAPGQVIQWIDTCDGDGLEACAVAFSNCTCDEIATVTMSTQHRER